MSRHEYWFNYGEVNRLADKFTKKFIRKNYQACCNCIEVNKHYKAKVTRYMIYNTNSGNTFKTIINKDGLCKFCRHYAFYSVVDEKGRGIEKTV